MRFPLNYENGEAIAGYRVSTPMGKSASPACSTCGPWWRLPLLLAIVLAAILLSRSRWLRETTTEPTRDSAPRTSPAETDEQVTLTIDFGDGRRQKYEPIAWREGMTVHDLTRETPRADAQLATRGTGESAFLTNLDGVANEGGGGRNWTYTVNGRLGDRSFAVYELRPEDEVLWSYAAQQ
ncbi:MAG: DUF4430 domain-containing protein [Pirellulales bacterium]